MQSKRRSSSSSKVFITEDADLALGWVLAEGRLTLLAATCIKRILDQVFGFSSQI